jgi:hypothetical protein
MVKNAKARATVRAMPGTLGSLAYAEPVRAAFLAAVVAIPLAAFGPPGGDMPAHLYRTMLVEDGVLVWDNLWYGGHYPLASYSLLYYLPATVFGNLPLAVAAVIVSAALFASICREEWGERAVWPARVFAVLASGSIFTGTYTYALGLAALLAAIRALQARRTWLALAAAALCIGFSPLAYVFLCLACAAIVLARGRLDRRAVIVGVGLALLAGVQASAIWLFPHEAVYPFRLFELGVVVTVSALGAALAMRGERARVLAALFALWAFLSVVVFAVPSPIGENITRLRGLVFALVLLAAVLARFRPYWLAAPALAAALAYTLIPYVAVIPYRTDGRPAEEAYWEPALDFLRANSDPGHRVEVVPTGDHWEAYWVPKAGFALARGWYRQLDIAQNPLFYEEPLRAEDYREWLRDLGVRYVLLPDTQLGRMGEQREADLLTSGRSGLRKVFVTENWRIYELPRADPILTGTGDGKLTELGHERVAGSLPAPGDYRLRVRYTRYWRVERGRLCLSESADGMTVLRARAAGPFVLELDEHPDTLVRAAVGNGSAAC